MAITSPSPPLPWAEVSGESPARGEQCDPRRRRAAVFIYPAAQAPGAAAGGGEEKTAPAPEAAAQTSAAEAAAFERGRAAGRAEAAAQVRGQAAAALSAERAAIGLVVGAFARARAGYFVQVEGEVVRLALSIARRVLHREAQIDPLLLRGAVRLALERLDQNTGVRLRVPAGQGAEWRRAFAAPQALAPGARIPPVVEDAALGGDECVLETELGETRCSIEQQLREIEQGFFDLIAERGESAAAPHPDGLAAIAPAAVPHANEAAGAAPAAS